MCSLKPIVPDYLGNVVNVCCCCCGGHFIILLIISFNMLNSRMSAIVIMLRV